ncbi:MAG TPA: DNA-binding protein [Geobacteraceae bacterium]|nr:DNA-binding protein [Geobacteraceae bacterium]
MKRCALFAATLAVLSVALPATSRSEEAPAPPPLPKGHPPLTAPQENAAISGKVLKTMDSGGYTYMFLEVKGNKKIWVAVPRTKVSVGKKIAFIPGPEMKHFKSKTLNRTFDTIIFSAGLAGKKEDANGRKEAVVTPGSKGAMVAAEKVSVPRATGADAHTVAELYALKSSLNGKRVVVRGKVVKVASHIMKMNWVHLQDGTGSADKNDHDLVVTTKASPAMGETITVRGTLLKDKDYGYGYKYDVLIDSAEIVR